MEGIQHGDDKNSWDFYISCSLNERDIFILFYKMLSCRERELKTENKRPKRIPKKR